MAEAEVRFIVIGGMAGIAHGSARVTFDLDCVYDRDTEELRIFGQPCRVVSLPRLIALKRAAGRPKDLEAIAELEVLEEERR